MILQWWLSWAESFRKSCTVLNREMGIEHNLFQKAKLVMFVTHATELLSRENFIVGYLFEL